MLSAQDKEEIRRFYSYGNHTQKELASLYGVSQARISKIIGASVKARAFSVAQVQEIRHALKTGGSTYKELAAKYNCPVGSLTAIKNGRTYKDVPLSEKELDLANKLGQIKARRENLLGKDVSAFPLTLTDKDLHDGMILRTPVGNFIIHALDIQPKSVA